MQQTSIQLAQADLAVVAGYLALVLAIGLWAGRRERNAEDFFLAGRSLPWVLIGLSFYASNMSGASFVGLTAASYSHGVSVFSYEWTATLVLIVFALVMLPVFLRARLFTVPEYLERRFDVRARRVYSAFTILAVLFIDTAGALYAGGVVITAAFPMIALWQACALIATIAGLYTILGGLRAVVATDALQAVLIVLGGAVILVIGLERVGGWNALMDDLADERRALLRPAGDEFLPWPGIMGVVLLGFYYWTLNQYFVQRALAARSLADAQRGALFGGLLKLPNLFLVIVPGIIAYRLFPDLPHADLAFPMLAFELLPIGLRGLIVTAVLAAIMSSLDSALNAAASLATMDFVAPRHPAWSGQRLLAIGRLFTAVAMVAGALYAPLIREFGTLFEYFQSTLAYLTPPVVAVFLGGLAWRRATTDGGVAALLGGIVTGAALFVAKEVTGVWAALGLPPVHFTYMAIVMFCATMAILIAVSLAGAPPPPERIAITTIRRTDLTAPAGDGRSLLADPRTQATLLALLLAGTIAWAW